MIKCAVLALMWPRLWQWRCFLLRFSPSSDEELQEQVTPFGVVAALFTTDPVQKAGVQQQRSAVAAGGRNTTNGGHPDQAFSSSRGATARLAAVQQEKSGFQQSQALPGIMGNL